MSTDGTKITEDEELAKELRKIGKGILVGIIIFILYGLLIYGN
jgi:hypothetical protein